ncbi:MAG: shikimate dehydrogenase [Gammaproteobacteria bacterium]|jgi:shikimate dehydrogenase|nr:shikimate dehydrogenase [Gammaproteobacteria bacterium]
MPDHPARVLKLAVFGDPIAHSRSPELHRFFAAATGLSISYERIHARADELATKLHAFIAAGGHGANITVPHKQAVMAHCDQLSPRAVRAAAVNTLARSDSGWLGDNTDGAGLLLDLQDKGVELTGAGVLIIGAGGATRGIVPALLDAGVGHIVVANRSAAKAQDLVQTLADNRVVASALKPGYGETFDLLIHATAAGHHGSALPLPEILPGRPYCYDLSYGTASHNFLHWAAQHGCRHSDGLGMLVAQAAESFKLWTGQTISPELRAALFRQLQQ